MSTEWQNAKKFRIPGKGRQKTLKALKRQRSKKGRRDISVYRKTDSRDII